jgi:glycosyltransferase involved in cell wall biosynthesis
MMGRCLVAVREELEQGAATLPGLFVVGPLGNRGRDRATTQGDLIAERFARDGYQVISASGSPGPLARFGDVLRTFARCRSWADTLLVQTYSGRAFLLAAAAVALGRLLGQRVVLHVHGGGVPHLIGRFPRMVGAVMGAADAIVVPSTYLASAIAGWGHAVRVIPNSIDADLYPYHERASVGPRLFWMRTFHDIYNPFMALRVLGGVRARYPDATLIMAGGDKGIERGVQREAARLGLERAVRFPGFLDLEGKLREAERSDIFINTSRIDNTPVAIIEAAALGLPVVTTSVGGIPHLLEHERTGLLVPDGDDQAMIDGIVSLIERTDLARSLSIAGRALAQEFSWEAVRYKWEEFFLSLPQPAPRT